MGKPVTGAYKERQNFAKSKDHFEYKILLSKAIKASVILSIMQNSHKEPRGRHQTYGGFRFKIYDVQGQFCK